MMNRRLLNRALQREKAKRALGISVIVHVILSIVYVLFFVPSVVLEMEDEIQVDLISEVLRKPIEKKKVAPMPKKEPEPENVEMPIPEEIPKIKHRQSDITKEVNVVAKTHSLEITKMSAASPTPTPVDIPQESHAVAPLKLDPIDLSTDAQLPNNPESVLSPLVGGAEVASATQSGYVTRRETHAKTPGKGTKQTIVESVQGTGADKGKGVFGTEAGSGNGSTFSSIIKDLADDIIQSSGGAPIDVVFVVDASGSMQDNINAVAKHLVEMIDAYKASEIDYQLGLTQFNMNGNGTNNIRVHPLTNNLSSYRQRLYAIVPSGDENALDAIDKTLKECRFRNNTVKHLILLTDEPFTTLSPDLSVDSVINLCRNREIYVNVLGENITEHKRLAKETGGTWHAVPKDPIPQKVMTTQQPKDIGHMIRTSAANFPTDIIFFIDTSKSMEQKMLYIREQIDTWLRDWDNALIDYRLGVVRFRAKGATNIVNVYNLPQTQSEIHKILKLPCQDNENLLSAINEAVKRIKTRPNAKTHFIVFTDEPGDPKYPTGGTLQLLKEIPAIVSVIGTTDTFHQQLAQQTGGIWVAIPNGHKRNEPYH